MPPPHYGAAPCTLVYTKLRQIDRLTEHDVLRHVDVMRAEDHDALLKSLSLIKVSCTLKR